MVVLINNYHRLHHQSVIAYKYFLFHFGQGHKMYYAIPNKVSQGNLDLISQKILLLTRCL